MGVFTWETAREYAEEIKHIPLPQLRSWASTCIEIADSVDIVRALAACLMTHSRALATAILRARNGTISYIGKWDKCHLTKSGEQYISIISTYLRPHNYL
eukprot:2958146-Pleurochrysis_carterae.AAC.2